MIDMHLLRRGQRVAGWEQRRDAVLAERAARFDAEYGDELARARALNREPVSLPRLLQVPGAARLRGSRSSFHGD